MLPPYPPQKKLLERKGNSITPAKTNVPISQTSSELLKWSIQTYQMRNKKLKMKLGQLQEQISKAFLPVSADLSNDCQSIIFGNWSKKNLPFMRLILEEQQKYLQSFINNATYHPMNPDADVTYQIVNLLCSGKCFIYFSSDVPHYISSTLSVQFW